MMPGCPGQNDEVEHFLGDPDVMHAIGLILGQWQCSSVMIAEPA